MPASDTGPGFILIESPEIAVECATCGYELLIAAQYLERGLPACPCGGEMRIAADQPA